MIEFYIIVSSIGTSILCNVLIPIQVLTIVDVSTGPKWCVEYSDYSPLPISVCNFVQQLVGVHVKSVHNHMHHLSLAPLQSLWKHSEIVVH